MRMRKKKHGAERIDACSDLLCINTTVSDENLIEIFGFAPSSVRLEIGCGKGAFVCGMAAREPDVGFLALERVPDVAMLAMEKCKSLGIKNVRFIIGDVMKLWDLFADHSLDRIYLNFSDPWPKERHSKRRLTYREFLDGYRRILKPNGAIIQKTDNLALFEFSLIEFADNGFRLENLTHDLHASPLAENNIETEYEKNFSEKGFKINYVEAWLS